MEPSLRELVLNEAGAYALFGAGRLRDHRFAVSVVCEELPDLRFNRAFIIDPSKLTAEKLEEVSRDFFSVQLPLRLDIFVPIPSETEELLKRRRFDLTEDYAAEMVLKDVPPAVRKSRAIRIERLTPRFVDQFSTVICKAFNTPPDVAPVIVSILRHTVPPALEHKNAVFYLAFLGADPVGTIFLYSKENVGGIYNLAVTQDARRRGVASTLMLKAMEDSAAAGNEVLCLQTRVGSVQERFFERLGFEMIARRKRAVRESA